MATTSVLKSIGGEISADYYDTVTHVYEVTYDAIPTNLHQAYELAKAATGAPVPGRGAALVGSTGLYAGTITPEPQIVRTIWQWTVTYTRPSPEDLSNFTRPDGPATNPLLIPAVYNIAYQDREFVITKGKNTEAHAHGDGNGGNRAANTYGNITNSVGAKPVEPHLDVERIEVLQITKNYPSLAAIVSTNRTYKRSTNSDAVQGYQVRELKYQLTESLGMQVMNGIEFWPGTTTILAEGNTDLSFDNVGYYYWDNAAPAGFANFKDKDGDALADLGNLKLDGSTGGDVVTPVVYTYLNQVAYSPLF